MQLLRDQIVRRMDGAKAFDVVREIGDGCAQCERRRLNARNRLTGEYLVIVDICARIEPGLICV